MSSLDETLLKRSYEHTEAMLMSILALRMGEPISISHRLMQAAREGKIKVKTRVEGNSTVLWAEGA